MDVEGGVQSLITSELIALGSLVVAALTLAGSAIKGSKTGAARDQFVSDKLDLNNEMAKETRDTVRELSRKIDDFSHRLAKTEEQVDTLFRRVSRIEKNMDVRFNVGREVTD